MDKRNYVIFKSQAYDRFKDLCKAIRFDYDNKKITKETFNYNFYGRAYKTGITKRELMNFVFDCDELTEKVIMDGYMQIYLYRKAGNERREQRMKQNKITSNFKEIPQGMSEEEYGHALALIKAGYKITVERPAVKLIG